MKNNKKPSKIKIRLSVIVVLVRVNREPLYIKLFKIIFNETKEGLKLPTVAIIATSTRTDGSTGPPTDLTKQTNAKSSHIKPPRPIEGR